MEKSKLLLVNNILGTIYAIYIITYFAGALSGSAETAEQVGTGLAAMLVMPHMFVTLIAALMGWLAYFWNKAGFALASAILYCVAAFLFLLYAVFLIPMIILGFVGYGKVKKIQEVKKAQLVVNAI